MYTVGATSVLDSSVICVYELTFYCCFIFCCCCCFSFLLPRSLCFFYKEYPPRRFFSIICSRLAPWRISSPSWNASVQLVKLCTPQCAWLLKRLVFAKVEDLTSSWHKTTNCYRATIVCLDAKGLWKPEQSFILAEFTLSLPCSAPCRTEQTTIDTGCRDDRIVFFCYFWKIISGSDPNPVLFKIMLSVSENYPEVYYHAQHTFFVVSILPHAAEVILPLAEHDWLK